MHRDLSLTTNATVDINLLGLVNHQAIVIPIQLCGTTHQTNSDDWSVGELGIALVKELPYVKAILCRLFPEMVFFLKNVQLQLSTDLDNQYDCELIQLLLSFHLHYPFVCCYVSF